MPRNLYFEDKEEWYKIREALLAEVDRGKRVSLEDLETYLQQDYGPDYCVCQPRDPDNADCIVRRKSDNFEFSAAYWVKEVLKIRDLKGCNKSCLFALKWMRSVRKGWET